MGDYEYEASVNPNDALAILQFYVGKRSSLTVDLYG